MSVNSTAPLYTFDFAERIDVGLKQTDKIHLSFHQVNSCEPQYSNMQLTIRDAYRLVGDLIELLGEDHTRINAKLAQL